MNLNSKWSAWQNLVSKKVETVEPKVLPNKETVKPLEVKTPIIEPEPIIEEIPVETPVVTVIETPEIQPEIVEPKPKIKKSKA